MGGPSLNKIEVSNTSGGGSRAAKKRARAKAKQVKKQREKETKTVSIEKNEKTIESSSKKRKQEDSIETVIEKKDSKKTSKEKVKKSDDKNDDGSNINSCDKKKVKFTKDTNFEPKPDPSFLNDFFTSKDNSPTLREVLFPSAPIYDSNDKEEDETSKVDINSLTIEERAKLLLTTILYPTVTVDEFYSEYWEKKPLFIPAHSDHKSRLQGFLTKKSIKHLLSTQSLRYGKDLNVTNYTKTATASGKKEKRRVTLDLLPEKTPTKEEDYILVDAKDVWANFESNEPTSACTIRLLCPQKYIDPIHSLLSLFESEFGCMVGANAYLTPPNGAQGFAPHYDDIEAFVLQLEGEKHWKVYPPFPGTHNILPRTSSRDFTMKEMKNHEPVLDVILKEGDVLYMPRGWIHQASTSNPSNSSSKKHSLHLTISAMQNWAWVDLMDILIPDALQTCANESLSLREGLPKNFVSYMGLMHQGENPNKDERTLTKEEAFYEEEDVKQKRLSRKAFKEEAKNRIMRVCKEAISMIDDGCDQISKRFLSDRLPPAFTETEILHTSEGPNMPDIIKKVFPNTLCRLVRPNIARVVIEEVPPTEEDDDDDDEPTRKAVLYHCNENMREYHGHPLQPMEFELDDAPALEMLLTTIEPQWVCVNDLTHEGHIEDKVGIAQALYDEGILAIWNPAGGV